MSASQVLADLDKLITQALPEDRPGLVVALAARVAQLGAGLPAPTSGQPAEEADRLLTLPQVAQLLGVPEDYAYTLARQRKVPTVRLPGLNKGGKTREGKYLRVRVSSLRALVAGLEDKGLDGGFNTAIKSLRDRKRGAEDPKAARSVSDRVRQARGRHVRNGLPLGDGREQDPGAHGEVDSAPVVPNH